MIHPTFVTAYRLLRRLMLLPLPKKRLDNPHHSVTEYVTWFIEQPDGTNGGTRLGSLIRGFADQPRSLELYSPEEMETVSQRIAERIISLEPDGSAPENDKAHAAARAEAWPHWPEGWRDSLQDAMREQQR